MRLIKPISAVGAVALLTLTACGSSSNNSNSGGATNTAINKSGSAGFKALDPNAKAPAPPIPGSHKGGTIYVTSILGAQTFDPTEAYYLNTSAILEGLVTRTLTQWRYDKKANNDTLIPDAATNLGTHNKDCTVWKFTIRPGIKWENGSPVTMNDWKFGIERSFDRDTFPGGANYSNEYFLDGNTYKGPYKSGTNYKGISISGNTITLKMARPFCDMPYWGSFPAMGPIPSKASINDPTKYRLHPWSTGPYKFGKYTPGQTLQLVKNTAWDPNTDPGRRQNANEWDFNFTTPSSQIDQTLLNDNGQGKTTLTIDSILPADFGKAEATAKDRLSIGGEPCTFMLYPDYRKIKDKRVREAIAYAYPYKSAWLTGGYIAGVTRVPAGPYMAPGVPGRINYKALAPDKPAQTDPAKSVALLKAAGYKPGQFKLSFDYATNSTQSVNAKNQLVAAFKKGGFNPQPYAVADSTKAGELLGDPNAPINLRSIGWCSDWPSGLTWLPPVFQTNKSVGANYSFFSEKSVDNRIAAIGKLPFDQQPHAWGLLDEYINHKYFPNIVTGYGGAAMMHGSKIGGMYDDPVWAMPNYKDIYVIP
jgi:peptide/nickel transport system substrate-binding protein